MAKLKPTTQTVPAKPELPEDVAQEALTEARLQYYRNYLPVTIPVQEGQFKGQRIHLRIGGPNEEPSVFATIDSADQPTIVQVPAKVLRRFPNGVHLLYYTIERPFSKGTFLRLNLREEDVAPPSESKKGK